jgi:hypothetical protein
VSQAFDEIGQVAREHYETQCHAGKALFGAPDVDQALRQEGQRREAELSPWSPLWHPIDKLLALPWVVDPDIPAGTWELRDWPPR